MGWWTRYRASRASTIHPFSVVIGRTSTCLLPLTPNLNPLEIIAISNYLQCPIHVYELCQSGKKFALQPKALFGSPTFDDKAPLYILSADGRFPDIAPGDQKENGDHFLALYPCPCRESKPEDIKHSSIFSPFAVSGFEYDYLSLEKDTVFFV